MKTNTLGWLVGLGALVCSFTSCSESAVECQVGLATSGLGYAVVYTVVGTPPACTTMNGFKIQRGDIIGAEFYHPPTADMSTYDSTKSTVSLQADYLGNVQAADSSFMEV